MNNLVSAQKLAKAANGNIEAFQSLADTILNATERLLALNIDAARSACARVSVSAAPLVEGDMREQFASRLAAQNQSLEQAADYFRNVNELFFQTQSEIAAFGTRQFDEAARGLGEFVENFAHTAPTGTNDFVNAVKTAMSNASAAYESFVKTSRDVAETNLAAASNALQPMLTAQANSTKSRKAA
ncbi:phasin family protein [Aromatoleum toluclasticum]|uniref:phasin family protein n=1 Tax=Aromatoleum toluclasticum TaxID=92003 RepID=UPI001D184970|nr:phasin family protein [Aromatoleum toluclasticum]MCC4114623.1 phasin family protein [Aromatoleum toluclasticum]